MERDKKQFVAISIEYDNPENIKISQPCHTKEDAMTLMHAMITRDINETLSTPSENEEEERVDREWADHLRKQIREGGESVWDEYNCVDYRVVECE